MADENPTHALLDDEGELVALVFPDEGTDGELVELPAGFWSCPHLWDKEARTFAPDMATVRAAAWEKVKGIRATRLLLSPTPFGAAQTDVESMVKINGLVSMAMLAKGSGQAFSETFTMADNSEVPMDADQMIAFGVSVGSYIAATHARSRALYAEIQAAPTAEEVEAIDLNAGWP
jgi:hypothetical protein